MLESLYCIHGFGLRFATNSPPIAKAVQTHMRHFQRRALPPVPVLDCVLQGVQAPSDIPIVVSATAHKLCTQRWEILGDTTKGLWQCQLLRDGAFLVADFQERGMVRLDTTQGCAEGYVVQPDRLHADVLASVFHHFVLSELLKRQGLYSIHAAALEKHGRGILIPGASGRGKTTSCIALLRAGYRCLSDDHPLLRDQATHLELLSFPVKIDVTAKTVAFFPELQGSKAPLYQGLCKHYFYANTLYRNVQTDVCEPVLILFPQIVKTPRSSLEPLSKSRAFAEFLPQGLLVLDKGVASRQFHVLSRLIQKAACYRLYFGEDVLALPRLIDPLFERVRS